MTDITSGGPHDDQSSRPRDCPTDRHDCPSDQEIDEFCGGRIGADEAIRLADLIDQCPVCEKFAAECEARIHRRWGALEKTAQLNHPGAEVAGRQRRESPDSTSASLLRRLQSDQREIAWERFVELYAPLIYHWICRAGLTSQDASDCVQDVLIVLVNKLPTFLYDPQRSFRAWLHTVTVNKCRDAFRRGGTIAHSAVPLQSEDAISQDDVELFSDVEYRQALCRRALQIMQAEFETATWRACWEQVVVGTTAADVAKQLGITRNAAYLAKSRVLRRLRQELDGLTD